MSDATVLPRILMVTARFLPHVGGTEIHTHSLACKLVARGVDVTILTTELQEVPLRDLESDFDFPVLRVKAWPHDRDWYVAPKILEAIRGSGCDVVHVQGIHTVVLPMALAAARRACLPYVITLHSGGHSSGFRQLSRRLVWKAFGGWIRAAESIIAVSEFERRTFGQLLAIPDRKLRVIPSGVEVPPRGPSPGGVDGRDDVRTPLIVSVGRLERYKGHDRILRALPAIAKEFPRVRLVILGAGPDERRLLRIMKEVGVDERVMILTIRANRRSDLLALFARADLVVALSAYESQGLAAMEAVASGCSVLVANSSALGELVTAGLARGVGLGSTDELVSAVVRQLRKPHRPAAKLPTWDECAAATLELYMSAWRG